MSYWWRNKYIFTIEKHANVHYACEWEFNSSGRFCHCLKYIFGNFNGIEKEKKLKENNCTETNEENDIKIPFFFIPKLVFESLKCECIQSSGFHYLLSHKLTWFVHSNDWTKMFEQLNQVLTKINFFPLKLRYTVYTIHGRLFFVSIHFFGSFW